MNQEEKKKVLLTLLNSSEFVKLFPYVNKDRQGALLFSGGVDSFATLKRQKNNIKYMILYYGADIKLTDPERYKEVKNYMEQCARDYDKELITMETNAHHLHNVSWEYIRGRRRSLHIKTSRY